MRKTKIDNVYIVNTDGIDFLRFHITKLKEAEKKAKEMTEYHQKKYTVKIINEYVDNNGYGFQKRSNILEENNGKGK